MTIFYDLPNTDYRALPGLSGTQIKTMLESPAMLDVPKPRTDAMRFGSAFHGYVLEAETPLAAPFDDFRSKEAREWKADHADDIWVTNTEAERLERMYRAVMDHDDASQILQAPGQSEVTVTWDLDGVPMKGRIDRLTNRRVVDLKSIGNVSGDFLDSCMKAIGEFGVHAQQMHYRNGCAANSETVGGNPVLIYVETAAPYRVAVIELSELDAAQGEAMCQEAYRRYADCTTSGVWPSGSPEGVRESRVPSWAARKWDNALAGM